MKKAQQMMIVPQLADLYYHRDFDGVVSAALLLALSRKKLVLHPVNYDISSQWSSMKLGAATGVVDFLFHPDALLWIDHHADPFLSSEWKTRVEGNKNYIWDTNAPSCPQLIQQHFDISEVIHRHFADYVSWSSIIDSALFSSAKQATDLTNPFILLSKVLSLPVPGDFPNLVVEQVLENPVDAVLAHPRIETEADKVTAFECVVRQEAPALIHFDGLVARFDQSTKTWPYQRYFPYTVYPEAVFVIGIYKTDVALIVSVGANPWKPSPGVDLALLCRKLGGGGRKDVAGVPVGTYTDAMDVANQLTKAIHERLRPVSE